MTEFLISGYLRSGTTFFANFLNSQKNIYVGTDFLQTIFRASHAINIKDFNKILTEREKNIMLSELKGEAIRFKVNWFENLNTNFSTLLELYNISLKEIKKQERKKVIGTKVTITGKWINKLLDQTNIKVIYLYRDPRDVLLSSKNRFAFYNYYRTFFEWKNDIENVISLSNKNLLILKFEDLVLDTNETLKKVEKFLEVDISIDKTHTSHSGVKWTNNSSFHDIKKIFDPTSCFRWKKEKKKKRNYTYRNFYPKTFEKIRLSYFKKI